MNLDASSPEEFFSRSLEAFKNSIPPSKRDALKSLRDGDTMVAELKLALARGQGGRFENACLQISRFSGALTTYFHVLNTFMMVSPETTGWFWGSILLVCQLGSSYAGFFEKTADMLSSIALEMPQYADYVVTCNARSDIKSPRLLKTLSFLYTDIIDFCAQICDMFSRTGRGSNLLRRMTFIAEVMWRPFDVRFRGLIERTRRHREVFLEEMRLSDSKMLNDLQKVAAIEKTLNLRYKNLQKSIDSSFQRLDSVATAAEEKRAANEAESVAVQIKQWMSPAEYRNIFEHARRERFEGTGGATLSSPQYKNWRDGGFSDRSDEAEASSASKTAQGITSKILLLRGKPGFGKTYLSTVIIDDLCAQPSPALPPTTPQMAPQDPARVRLTAFYHFSSASNFPVGRTTASALRAIVTQMAHMLRGHPVLLDPVSVLHMGGLQSGQLQASSDEAEAALQIMVQTSPTHLVIDGIDECEDPQHLLGVLVNLCFNSDCRILLLGRPDMILPRPFLKSSPVILDLTKEHNTDDIRRYIGVEFDAMIEDGLFGTVALPPDSQNRASQHANGMFLWSSLFIGYLKNPGLKPRDRHKFVADVLLFEGLDGLTEVILDRLAQRSTEEKANIRNIFHWVVAALYPVSTATLHTALAITAGQETTELDYLANFPQCLPHLTGALVELDADGRPALIHLSIREYLTSARSAKFASFSMSNPLPVHEEFAARCLSYLTHDIPKRPILPLVKAAPRSLVRRGPASRH
ncbi:hypothetical protein MAPG_10532, partial [Magnaporthiopsis poae ATCC 64411]